MRMHTCSGHGLLAIVICKSVQPRSRLGRPCLHEAAEAEDGVVEAALLDVLLCAGLDLHQGDLRVPLCIVDAEEDVPLDAHGLQMHLNLVGTSR